MVAGAVGLLVYLYLFNQLLLFGGGAGRATSPHGRVVDLAADPPRSRTMTTSQLRLSPSGKPATVG